MKTKIQKWGNSLALRIPKTLADEALLNEGSSVKLKLEDNKIVISKEKKTTYSLKDLLSKVSKANLHKEFDFGDSAGKEIL